MKSLLFRIGLLSLVVFVLLVPTKVLAEGIAGISGLQKLDAAVNWGNGKAYFFRNGQYIRYDVKADRADPGYPKPIDSETWPGLRSLLTGFF